MVDTDASGEPGLRVFISYSRNDAPFAQELVAGLQFGGFEPYIDTRDVVAGEEWEVRLGRLIEQADTVIFIVSPDALRSERCAWEVQHAVKHHKRIFPVIWRSVPEADVPPPLQQRNYVFFDKQHSFAPALVELAAALRTDTDWIREHTRIGEAAQRWHARSRAEALLFRGGELAAARLWAKAQPKYAPEPTLLTLEFLDASGSAEQTRENEERQRLALLDQAQNERQKALDAEQAALQRARAALDRASAADRKRRRLGAAALTIVSLFAALVAWQWRVAVTAEQTAQQEFRRAETLLSRALTTQSLLLADLSRRHTTEGNATTGALFALEALPAPGSGNRPYIPEAERALYLSLLNLRETKLLVGHKNAVWRADYNADASKLATASFDDTAIVWDAAAGKQLLHLKGHTSLVRSARFSPDGSLIATTSDDKTIRIWDASSGATLHLLSGHDGPVWGALFTVDGKSVLTYSVDGTAKLWAAGDGKLLQTMVHEPPPKPPADGGPVPFELHGLLAADVDRGGRRIATASRRGSVKLWDPRTGALLSTLEGHAGEVWHVEFSPDGMRLATAGNDGTVRLWFVDEQREPMVLRGHQDWVKSARFDRSGDLLITASGDGTARIWDARTGEHKVLLSGHQGSIGHAEFSPDGSSALTLSGTFPEETNPFDGIARSDVAPPDNSMRIWDTRSGKQSATLKPNSYLMFSARFMPDSKSIVTTGIDDLVRLWKLQPLASSEALPGRWQRADLSQSGLLAVLVDPTGNPHIWRGSDKAVLPLRTSGEQLELVTTRIAGSDEAIAALDKHGNLVVWSQPFDGTGIRLNGPDEIFERLAFNLARDVMVTASDDGQVKVWSIGQSARVIFECSGDWEVEHVELSQDGSKLLIAAKEGESRKLNLWSVPERKRIGTWTYEYVPSGQLLSPDGRLVAAPLELNHEKGYGPIFRVSDTGTGKEVGIIRGRPSHTSIHWARDSAQVALIDGSDIAIFDVKSEKNLFVLDGHNESVFDVRFMSDGRRLVSVGRDDTIRVWHLPTGKELLSLGELRDARKPAANWEVRPANVVSRDGRTFLFLSSDGAVKIWRLPATVEELTQAVSKAVVRCLTLDERESAQLERRPPQWCLSGVDDSRNAAPQSEEAKWPFQGSDWARWSSAVRRNLDPPLPGTVTWEKWSAESSKN